MNKRLQTFEGMGLGKKDIRLLHEKADKLARARFVYVEENKAKIIGMMRSAIEETLAGGGTEVVAVRRALKMASEFADRIEDALIKEQTDAMRRTPDATEIIPPQHELDETDAEAENLLHPASWNDLGKPDDGGDANEIPTDAPPDDDVFMGGNGFVSLDEHIEKVRRRKKRRR